MTRGREGITEDDKVAQRLMCLARLQVQWTLSLCQNGQGTARTREVLWDNLQGRLIAAACQE